MERSGERFGTWFERHSIRSQLLSGYAVLLVLFVTVLIVAAVLFQQYLATGARYAASLGTVATMVRTGMLGLNARDALRTYLLSGEDQALTTFHQYHDQYLIALDTLANQPNPGLAARWREIQTLQVAREAEINEPALALRARYDQGTADDGDLLSFIAANTAADARYLRAVSAVHQEIENDAYGEALRQLDLISAATQRLYITILIGAGLVILTGVILARSLIARILGSLRRTAAVAHDIANGQFDRRLGRRRDDEIGQMTAAFDQMAERIERLVAGQAAALALAEQQRALLHEVIEQVAAGIVLINHAGQVTLLNPPARAMLELGPAGAASVAAKSETAAGADRAPLAAADLARHLERIAAPPPVLSREFGPGALAAATPRPVVAARIGGDKYVQLASHPVVVPGETAPGRLFTLRDITAEREVDTMKSEFVSFVAHELRTPLTSVRGYVDLLLDGEVGDLTAEQRDFLTIVATNTNRLVVMINDLLDLSRIEAGKLELTLVPTDLAAVINQAVAGIRPLLDTKAQPVTIVAPPSLMVVGDRDRLIQVITNLLSNAHKYSPAGAPIEIVVTTAGAMAGIAVRDAGSGLTPAEQAQLFDRFFRAPSAQSISGTGLGLPIVRSLAEAQGGTVTVASELGVGSTFTVTIPLATPDRRHAPGPASAEAPANPLAPPGAILPLAPGLAFKPAAATLTDRHRVAPAARPGPAGGGAAHGGQAPGDD